MMIKDLDIDRVLYVPKERYDYDTDEEDEGLLHKLFSRKHKEKENYFETRINEFGKDRLLEELSGDVHAYLVENAPFEEMVIVTDCFLIFPGKDIFKLSTINRFALYNLTDLPFLEYALAREGVPYDPTYISEYEGEEAFEFDRFKIRLVIKDETNFQTEFVFAMEVEDRADFRDRLLERSFSKEYSSDDALEGWFNENREKMDILY